MRKAGVLFAIISLVGVNVVLGQWDGGATGPTVKTTNSNALVGIGITPTSKFQVYDVVNDGDEYLETNLTFNAYGLSSLMIDKIINKSFSFSHSYNGINIKNSNLAGTVYTYLALSPNNGGDSYLSLYGNTGNTSNFHIRNSLKTDILFYSSKEIMRLKPNGYVGIGTNAPATTLHIKGEATTIARIEPAGWSTGVAGSTAKLELGDPNTYLQMIYGTGIKLYTPNSLSLGIGTVEKMRIDATTGNMTIKTRLDVGDKIYSPTIADATVKLAVAGTVVAQKLKCTAASNWGDFVFDKNYALQPLAEVEQYVQANKHLPNIPTACELEANGIDTGEMLRLQMIKIEELTLHLIELQKEIVTLKKTIR